MSTAQKAPRRVRTVAHEPGWGWIARSARTGAEIVPNFRWASRAIARAVVEDAKAQPGTTQGDAS